MSWITVKRRRKKLEKGALVIGIGRERKRGKPDFEFSTGKLDLR